MQVGIHKNFEKKGYKGRTVKMTGRITEEFIKKFALR